jgi:NTE family protein
VSRAIVLGGGGPVGIGWEAGLLTGLAGDGLDLAAADLVVGTSAGSVIGCTLASGRDLTQSTALVATASGPDAATDRPGPDLGNASEAFQQLMVLFAEAAAAPGGEAEVRTRIGRLARKADTMSEERWLDMFAAFDGMEWPDGFRCTAVDTEDGAFRIWDRDAGVEVQAAVASSCAVPGLFPPVTIGGRRWMDGGVRDMVNADAASGHDIVLAVSCTLLDVPEGFPLPGLEPILAATRRRIDDLAGAGARVETIVPSPEMLAVSGWGMNLMDFTLAEAAYAAGLKQGEAEAGRLAGFWGRANRR